MNNLEIKARYPDLGQAEAIALSLGLTKEWTRTQTDTYFKAGQGKLKLRQMDGENAELIAYVRAAQTGQKISDYKIFQTADAPQLLDVLARALMVQVVVKKQRTLYLYKNVRIHLDRVENLGCFLEFEGVLANEHSFSETQKRIDFLLEQFKIDAASLLAAGYYEMLIDHPH
jgi:adenylate cyclase, class 2